jgi:hypothetical protein
VILRPTLIDKVVLSPVEVEGRTHLAIDLHGDIAGILSIAAKTEKQPRRGGFNLHCSTDKKAPARRRGPLCGERKSSTIRRRKFLDHIEYDTCNKRHSKQHILTHTHQTKRRGINAMSEVHLSNMLMAH